MTSFRLVVLACFLSFPVSLSGQAATLDVGARGDFKTLAEAVVASRAGDLILVESGTYTDDFSVIQHPLTIRGVGGPARLHAAKPIPNGKAILIADADLEIENIIFSNARVRDQNGAGIRHQKGLLVVKNSRFENNENGILGSSDPYAGVIIQDSHFVGNGRGDGYSHGIYIGKIETLIVKDSVFSDTKAGHHLKSRARSTTISGCLFDDGAARSSYAIDLPNGGSNLVRGNTLIQNKMPDNDIFISVGTKGLHPASALKVTGNRFINFAAGGTAVRNKMREAVVISDNTFFGTLVIARGLAKQTGNTAFAEVPLIGDPAESWQESKE